MWLGQNGRLNPESDVCLQLFEESVKQPDGLRGCGKVVGYPPTWQPVGRLLCMGWWLTEPLYLFLFDGIKKADLAATSACCEELTDSGNLKHKDENVELT